jgi:putative MATE family efflux protein
MKAQASYRSILKIAGPIMLGMLAQNFMQITNTAFLGRAGNIELGLNVSAMAGLFYFLITMLAFGFANGAQVLIARRMGEDREKEIGALFNHNLVVLGAYTIVAFIMLFVAAPYLLASFIPNKEVFDKSISFLHYRSFGVVFTILIICFNSFYVGVGRTKVMMYSTLATTLVNIGLDYTLIFGKFGFPALNTDGAAISSVVAEGVGLIVLVWNVLLNDYGSRMNLFKRSKIEWGNIRQLLNLSYPLVFQYTISMGAWYLFFILLGKMSDHALAISNILRSILFLSTISCWSIASASNSLVSNIMGQHKNYQVPTLIRKAVLLSLAITAVMVSFLALFPGLIMRIYTDDPLLIADARFPIYAMCCGLILLSAATVLFQSVQGTGNTKFNLLAEALAVCFYTAYLVAVVRPFHLSVTYAWLSEMVYWTTLGTVCLLYLRSGKWKNYRI